MAIEFCEKCGTMMVHKRIEDEVVLYCPKCENKISLTKKEKIVEQKVTKKEEKEKEKEKMVIIENPEQMKTMPTKKMECPKCKKVQETEYWAVQTRSGDEAATRFYRCTKCKATWREYD
jgi:DNA-directed RNA polymerase subunit M